MIVYNATKAQFNDDVNLNRISDNIRDNLRSKNIPGGELAEYHSWQNSLHFMRSAIDDPEIPSDVEIAIEYQIPRTSKRVDFMLAGADKDNNSNVVVIELKQWDIGSIQEIRKWSSFLGSHITMNEETVLRSQFRCNGSDQYIQLINNILQIGENVDVDINEIMGNQCR